MAAAVVGDAPSPHASARLLEMRGYPFPADIAPMGGASPWGKEHVSVERYGSNMMPGGSSGEVLEAEAVRFA